MTNRHQRRKNQVDALSLETYCFQTLLGLGEMEPVNRWVQTAWQPALAANDVIDKPMLKPRQPHGTKPLEFLHQAEHGDIKHALAVVTINLECGVCWLAREYAVLKAHALWPPLLGRPDQLLRRSAKQPHNGLGW